jgi:geranylgeranyl pyrophosphate synthase
MLPAIEEQLRQTTALAQGAGLDEYYSMLAYHLGWEGEGAGPEAAGKRIRPLLVLLSPAAAGGAWEIALPAATAIELVHNFSLIHDDIEDNSPLRARPPPSGKNGAFPRRSARRRHVHPGPPGDAAPGGNRLPAIALRRRASCR